MSIQIAPVEPVEGQGPPSLSDVMAALVSLQREMGALRAEGAVKDERIEALQAQVEQVRVEAGAVEPPPAVPNPNEMVWVINRSPKPFQFKHNSEDHRIAGMGRAQYPRWKAEWARGKSVRYIDVRTEETLFQLGIEGEHDTSPIDEQSLAGQVEILGGFDPATGRRVQVAVPRGVDPGRYVGRPVLATAE